MRREEKGEEPTKKTEIMPLFSQAWRNFDLNALRHALNDFTALLHTCDGTSFGLSMGDLSKWSLKPYSVVCVSGEDPWLRKASRQTRRKTKRQQCHGHQGRPSLAGTTQRSKRKTARSTHGTWKQRLLPVGRGSLSV